MKFIKISFKNRAIFMSKKFFLFIFTVILVLGLSISFQSLLAVWTAPTASPPTCVSGNPGCDAPLNISTATQTKMGSLGVVGAFTVGDNSYFAGKVGVGVAVPDNNVQMQINAPASTEGLRIVSAIDRSPLVIRNSTDTDPDIFRVDQSGTLQVGAIPWARIPSSTFPTACSSGQYATGVNPTSFICSTPAGTSYNVLANQGLRLSGTSFGLINTCTNNQLLKWNGSIWFCADDNSGAGGTVTSIAAGSSITISPNPLTITGTISLNLANANTWTAVQTINAGTGSVLKIIGGGDLEIDAQTSGNNSYLYNDTGILVLSTPLSVSGNITSSGKNVCLQDGTNCPAAVAEVDPVWTTASANYYTKTNLQISGQAQVHWDNLNNKPSFNYVSKAGDTMTGDLTINKATPLINLKRTSGNPEIDFGDATNHWGIYNAYEDSNKLKFWYGSNLVEIGTSGDLHAKWLHSTAVGNNTFAGNLTVSGNVGIGTTGPGYPLDVYIGSAGYKARFNDGTNALAVYTGWTGSFAGGLITTFGNIPLGLSANAGAGTLIISASGNVGIGTASPSERLQIKNPSDNGGIVKVGANAVATGVEKRIRFGDGDYVAVGEYSGQDDTLELKGSRIYMNGTVGIGTTNPTTGKLHVKTSSGYIAYFENIGTDPIGVHIRIKHQPTYYSYPFLVQDDSGHILFSVSAHADGDVKVGGSIIAGGSISANDVYTYSASGARGIYSHYSATNAKAFEAYAEGSGGIGFYSYGTGYDFYASGTGTDYGSASSIRWKTNIVPIDNALMKINNLRGVYFDWDKEHGGSHAVGFIGEEVAKVLPEIVEIDSQDPRYVTGMDYSKITPLLLEGIKELQKQTSWLIEAVKELVDKIADLANKVEDLFKKFLNHEDRIQALEKANQKQQKEIEALKAAIDKLKR